MTIKRISTVILLVLLLGMPVLGMPDCLPASCTSGLVQTKYACILSYRDTEIPEYLAGNFDRIFERLARFFGIFGVDVQNEKKILVWVVDFETLQELYCKETPKTVAAFYDSKFNRIYFTPRFINEYYITYELINHFVYEHREKAVPALTKFLILQELTEKSIVEEFILKNTN